MTRLTLPLILILVLLSGSHAGWWFSNKNNKTKNAEKIEVKTIQEDLKSAWSHTKEFASGKTSDAKKAVEDKKKEAKGKAEELKSKSKKVKDSVARESRGLLGDIKTRFGRLFKDDDGK